MMYCRYCGKTLPEDSDFCEGCGRRLKGGGCEAGQDASAPPVGAAAKGEAAGSGGAPDLEAGTVRCPNPNCGSIVRDGKPICPICGTVLPSKEQYEAKTYLYKKVQTLEKATNPLKTVLPLSLFIVIGFLCFSFLPHDILYDEFLGPLSLGDCIAIFLTLFTLFWGFHLFAFSIKRGRQIKKLGLTPQQYSSILREIMGRSAVSVRRRGGGSSQAGSGAKGAPKQPGKAAGRFFKIIMGVLCLCLGLMATNYFTDGAVYAFLDGAASPGGASMSGRWEATSRGSYDPAIVFRNGKAYFGIIGLSDDDIINDVGGIRQKADRNGVGYTVTSTSITFKSNNGISKTYKRDKNAIYFGPATMEKVANKP